MTIKRENRSEYLSKDIFDVEFLNVFTKFFKVLWMLGASRVEARDGFVTPPTFLQKLYTIVQTCIAIILFSFSYITYIYTYYLYPQILWLGITAYFVFVLSHIFIVINSRFYQNHGNAKFLQKMQEIDRIMGINGNQVINGMLHKSFDYTILSILGGFLGLLMLSCCGGILMVMTYVSLSWCFSVLLLEISLCVNLLLYFVLRLRFINAILLNEVEGNIKKGKAGQLCPIQINVIRNLFKCKMMAPLAAQTHDFRIADTDVYLKRLFECFSDFQHLYRFPIALHFITFFINILMAVELLVFGLTNNKFYIVEYAILATFMSTYIVNSLVLAIRFEVMFRTVKETRQLAVAIMSRILDGPLREKARKMYKLSSENPPRFSVYDMWHMNAVFLINFFHVVSTLVVTLLQFSLI